MQRFLDRIYLASGALAATAIVLITLIVAAQVVCNMITKIGIPGINLTIPSYGDISGYLLAAATFFGLPYTLVKGGHIRVTLLSGRMPPKVRLVMDAFALCIGLGVSAAGCWYMAALDRQSWMFGDMSSGIIPIPLWIVQIPLVLGLAVMTIAFADLLTRSLVTGRSAITDAASVE